MPKVMNFNMITLKDVKNFVKKFPEIELINEYDCYGKPHYYCMMKESPDIEVFEFHNDDDAPYIYLNQDIPLRANSEACKIYRFINNVPYGHGYYNLNELEKPMKKLVFMLDNLILVQKKMKMYEKKLDVENDFKE